MQFLSTLLQNVSIWINQGSIFIHTPVFFSRIVFEDRSSVESSQGCFWGDHDQFQEFTPFIFPNNAQDTFYVLWNGGVSI